MKLYYIFVGIMVKAGYATDKIYQEMVIFWSIEFHLLLFSCSGGDSTAPASGWDSMINSWIAVLNFS
jgi:hypothetical protein